MSTLFLSRDEIKELTAYAKPSKQIAWLRRSGLQFFVAGDGHPRVPKSNFTDKGNQRVSTPDFSALKASR